MEIISDMKYSVKPRFTYVYNSANYIIELFKTLLNCELIFELCNTVSDTDYFKIRILNSDSDMFFKVNIDKEEIFLCSLFESQKINYNDFNRIKNTFCANIKVNDKYIKELYNVIRFFRLLYESKNKYEISGTCFGIIKVSFGDKNIFLRNIDEEYTVFNIKSYTDYDLKDFIHKCFKFEEIIDYVENGGKF